MHRLHQTKRQQMEKIKLKTTKTKNANKCAAAGICGGCSYINGSYEKQLQEKEQYVKTQLKGICPVNPIIGMEDPYHYRNKVTATFSYKKGEILSGIYEEGSHSVVPVDFCLLEDQTADQIICDIRGLLKSFKVTIYSERTRYGLLRHVMIRRGFTTGEILVILVVTSPVFPSKNNFVKALRKLHPEITSVVLNINDRMTSMVLGERNVILYGKGYIEDVLCGNRFRISAQSFYQVNPVQTQKLYEKAVELAGLTGNEIVIDAYCGIGTIGMTASSKAKTVLGIELNSLAVKDAIANAKANHVTNIHFLQGDAGEQMTQMAEEGSCADVVFMDPPRSGSSEAFMDSAAILAPKRIVYVSCNPQTLARDLKYFAKKGYHAKQATPVDMFPWTKAEHVETVCLLEKGKKR